MDGEIALDSTVAIRFLNGDCNIVSKIELHSKIFLPVTAIGELLYGAKNSKKQTINLALYMKFIHRCETSSIGLQTAEIYSDIRLMLKAKGKPIPENDLWIAAQCIENNWTLVTDDKHFNEIGSLTIQKW